ncbi:Crp/Fnr family transcriptional regulator [uncultured Veillonella sp.]|uniref:Crp/Fnr family transcriptional regulator n=1 Tax=uncultured Veillonella sp. TaxID=159268 RepID=UPI00263249D6|nr:Crp/Fnr family transcriptional regulator [uncultured Veillonella sp.]
MLIPRYLFVEDFAVWKDFFQNQNPRVQHIKPGQFIWSPDETFHYVNFLESGLARTYLVHESGRRKILSYHGHNTIFPVFHELDFKIEKSLVTEAFTPMTIWQFTRSDFKKILEAHPEINHALLSWYARYVNLLIYETAHQEYNSGFVKLCNILWLMHKEQEYTKGQMYTYNPCSEYVDSVDAFDNKIVLTQEELAEILGMSRVNLTRHIGRLRTEGIIDTARKTITILDRHKLLQYCSGETRDE